MAAHSVSILLEFAEKLKYAIRQRTLTELKTALEYAPGMDELNYIHWQNLHDLTGQAPSEELRDRLYELTLGTLSHQLLQWMALRCPRHHDEWMSRKYGEEIVTPVLPFAWRNSALDAFGYLDAGSGVNDDFRRGLLSGLVSALMAITGDFKRSLIALKSLHDASWRHREHGREIDPQLLPEAWRKDWAEVCEMHHDV